MFSAGVGYGLWVLALFLALSVQVGGDEGTFFAAMSLCYRG